MSKWIQTAAGLAAGVVLATAGQAQADCGEVSITEMNGARPRSSPRFRNS